MSKALKRTFYTLFIAVGLYSLLGFLILPGVALRVVNQQLNNYATVPARLERIELNPFSLELNLWGLHIGQAEAEQLGFERLYLDLQLDSLWRKAVHLRDIRLEGANVDALRSREGELSLAKLFKLPESPPTPADEPASPMPAVVIERIALIQRVASSQLRISPQARPSAAHTSARCSQAADCPDGMRARRRAMRPPASS